MKNVINAAFLFLLLIVAMSCGAPAPTDATTTDALTVSLRQSANGFKATAVRDDARVTLTVSRLSPRSKDFVRDAEIDSPFESDLIVLNRYGFPFLASGNHDLPSDPETSALSLVPSRILDQWEQLEDLQLAADAVAHLRGLTDLGEKFRWELRSLHHMVAGALARANDVLDGNVVSETTPDAEEIGPELIGQAASPATPLNDALVAAADTLPRTYIHRVSIRYAVCCNRLGHHSAVLFELFASDGTYIASVSTRNHGREADDPSMIPATGCPRSWGGRTTAFPAFQPYLEHDTFFLGSDDAGGCHTKYGLWPGSHVCNDDSQAQYWNIKYNLSGTWATCEDRSLRWWAPHCE